MRLTHKKLCQIGAIWLKNSAIKKCPVVFIELKALIPEIPDVIGFNSGCSVLLEAKKSHSDFIRDRKKFMRQHPKYGVGNYRLYICKENLISKDELPDKWGLLYVTKDGVVRVIKTPFKGNMGRGLRFDASKEYERQIMYSALRRVFGKETLKNFHM